MPHRLTSRWRWVASLLLAALLVNFVAMTRSVRLANTDDVRLQAVFSQPEGRGLDRFLDDWSEQQGRFYFAAGSYRLPYAVYAVHDPVRFASARAAALFVQFALAGWLLARLCRNEAAGWLCTMVAMSALHLPAVPYPVLSYPAYAAGGMALLGALHCFLTGIERSSGRWLLCAAGLHLLALLWHENFIAFTVLYPAISWAARTGRPAGALIRANLPVLFVSAAYVGVYVGFRHLYSTGYDGTVLALKPVGAATSWMRQTLASAPGFELLVNRAAPYPTVGPLWKSAGQVLGILGSVPAAGLALALAASVAGAGLARQAGSSGAPSAPVVVFLLLAAALPNVIPSLTQKFQENAHHRFYPYVYSFGSYYWGVAAATALWLVLAAERGPGGAWPRLRLPLLFVLLLGVFVSAQASNRHTLELLRTWYN
jgi:hypothetical protein